MGKDILSIAGICGLISLVISLLVTAVNALLKMYKHHKYRDSFPSIIVDDGYGDIHRTIYPFEILAATLFSTAFRDSSVYQEQLTIYLRKELATAKKFRNRAKRRKYERITVLNVMTLIRKADV